MRILLDENVPVDILPVLKGCGHDAQSVNFAGLKGFQKIRDGVECTAQHSHDPEKGEIGD